MGLATQDFEGAIKSAVRDCLAKEQTVAVASRLSRNGKYVSITCTFLAQSRQQVDRVYAVLRAHPDVLTVL